MPTYVALLRGVMPTNAKMPELRQAFERAGFSDVRTVLGTGNVVFTTRKAALGTIERASEAAMLAHLGRTFPTIVRPLDALREMIETDPFAAFRIPANAKRIVTFLHEAPSPRPSLPIELDGATLLTMRGSEAFSAYVPSPKGPVFMALIERTFGKDVTTRTWDTVAKIVR